jgi:hypothetical protein
MKLHALKGVAYGALTGQEWEKTGGRTSGAFGQTLGRHF